jgi:hypothetical protein
MKELLKMWFNRITSSERNKPFNPLIWPFFISTFAYGFGFIVQNFTSASGGSSLYAAMTTIHATIPLVWGVVCILVIIGGFTFLVYNIPPIGKFSGLLGFMVWVFAAFCYILTGGWLPLFSVAVPNMYFWFWQYLSLTAFRKEDSDDKATMAAYDRGDYDDDNGGKALREANRGRDLQSNGSYTNPDDGGDSSRPLDTHPVV